MLVVAGVVVAFENDKGGGLLNTSEADGPTTTRETPEVVVSTTTTEPPAVVSGPTATTTRRATTTTRPRRTTTTQVEFADAPAELVCVNTTKSDPTPPPDDWATYWTEKPEPNDGLLLKICVEDRTPKVGELVKLYLLADDRDAKIGTGECDIFVSWDSNAGSLCRDTVVAPGEPQPTPKEEPGRVTMTYVHQYSEPGESTIDVSAWSGPNSPERHPYSSYNSIELRVNVHR